MKKLIKHLTPIQAIHYMRKRMWNEHFIKAFYIICKEDMRINMLDKDTSGEIVVARYNVASDRLKVSLSKDAICLTFSSVIHKLNNRVPLVLNNIKATIYIDSIITELNPVDYIVDTICGAIEWELQQFVYKVDVPRIVKSILINDTKATKHTLNILEKANMVCKYDEHLYLYRRFLTPFYRILDKMVPIGDFVDVRLVDFLSECYDTFGSIYQLADGRVFSERIYGDLFIFEYDTDKDMYRRVGETHSIYRKYKLMQRLSA